jgi:hypothetical protein
LRFAYPPYGYRIPRRVDEAHITMPFVLAALPTCAVIHQHRYWWIALRLATLQVPQTTQGG